MVCKTSKVRTQTGSGGEVMLENAGRFVTVNGLKMHYRVRGRRGAPPLLLLHGIMGNAWEWDTAIDRLTERFRVYALEQRGHGRTDWTPPFVAPQMGEDAAGFVRALDLWNVTLVGHSMGGLAGAFAVNGHPRRFARLVMLDIGPRSLDGAVAQGVAAALDWYGRQSYQDPDAAVAEWLAQDPYARPDLMRHYVEHGLWRGRDGLYRWRYDADGLMQFFREGAEPDRVAEALRGVSLPSLLIRGENSQVLSPDGAAEVMTLLPRSELRVIPGAAHDLGVQQPEAVAAAVLEFVSGEKGGEPTLLETRLEGSLEAPGAGYTAVLGDRRVAVL